MSWTTAKIDDLGPVANQLEGDGATEAGRRTGYEGLLVPKVVLLRSRHVYSSD